MACDFGGATTVGAMSHDVFEGVIGSDGERVGFEEFFGGVRNVQFFGVEDETEIWAAEGDEGGFVDWPREDAILVAFVDIIRYAVVAIESDVG